MVDTLPQTWSATHNEGNLPFAGLNREQKYPLPHPDFGYDPSALPWS